MIGGDGAVLDGLRDLVGDGLLRRLGRASSRAQERRDLPVDLYEDDDAYLAVFDAPGASAEDVQVRYLDGRVLVRVERLREFHEGFEMRFPGRGLSLSGEVALPDDAAVDAEAADATVTERGTLEIRLPKRAEAASAGEASDAAGE